MLAVLLAASLAAAEPALNAAPICGCHVAPEGLPEPRLEGQPASPPQAVDAVLPWTPAEAQRLAGCSPGGPPPMPTGPQATPSPPPSRGQRR